MILGKLVKHISEGYWFKVLVDFLVVVIGIFVALQVTQWSEDQEQNELKQNYYQRLVEELKSNSKFYDLSLSYYDTVVNHAEIVLRDINKPIEQLDSNLIFHAYHSTQRLGRNVLNYTIKDLLSNGIMTELSDLKFKDSLSLYNDMIKDESIQSPITAFRINIRGLIDIKLQRQIKAECGEVFVQSNLKQASITLPMKCDIEFDKEILMEQIIRLKNYTNLTKDLTFRINDLEWKINNFRIKQRKSEELIAYIQKNKIFL